MDSRIQIGYYETKSLGALTKGSGVREVSFDIKLATPFAAPPRAVVFLNGVTFTDGNYIISVGVINSLNHKDRLNQGRSNRIDL